ncbi:RhoGAP-domain-containing protein [Lentinus tigrinus ALCF2SS1-6]|uniref:RhoGAP-domain-containing protein n=1 Tax=Lentinus tigrinus ALCF2SS1-6 TaxID=1328759 RepID=A0A5C2SR49_9APHY|nr:RhoGAP-domain-containing protein [Lentinus tigrinus ALCF2SS1-6]
MPSSQPRTTDTHAPSSNVPTSLSSTSLSSSLSSSRASSDLLPAAPPSSSSQSDIITSDRSASSLSSTTKPRFFPLALTSASVPPRVASLANMGQSQARPAAPPSPPPLSPAPSSASSAGNRLKRAWAGRRKKSEDITAMFSNMERAGKGNERDMVAAKPPPSAMPDLNDLRLERPPSRGLGGPKILQSVFGGGRKASSQKSSGQVSAVLPPPPPPKPASTGRRTPSTSPPQTPAKDAHFPAAVQAPRQALQRAQPAQPAQPLQSAQPAQPAPPAKSVEHSRRPSDGGDALPSVAAEKAKEDWRKSDSTMASHSTIRPGALSGNRSPRPVSLAESSHSGNTIVPPVNKRLSALITDAEFTMFEETDGSVLELETSSRPPASGRPSPTSSLKARNRRSASLSLAPLRTSGKTSPPIAVQSPPRNFSENPLSPSRDTPTLTRTAATGIIAPVNGGGSVQTTDNNIRGRLAAWTAVQASSPQAHVERSVTDLPSPQPRRPPGTLSPPPVNPTFRQTAVSMTGSLAPAAGIAMGFGKRAVEKVGRAWGGLTSSTSNHSGYSSSSSTGMSDSASGYASSHHSGPTGRKARRKAPHAFSNASSISSLASSSSEDHFVPTGPQLGSRLRGPKLSSSGLSIVGGLVFKRDLRSCVYETAADVVLTRLAGGQQDAFFGFRPLESRLLPALVLRCAQHILRWGVQEEGLFRISGRSSHVARLRAEFDAGADYNLVECEPGDLDPHAVSSIFKTFLRELPEPVLTKGLLSIFESALADDQGRRSEDVTQKHAVPRNASNLPLRKPPSLSTLAMPSFAGARAISDAQLAMISYLVSQLPQENRDLLYTVVELIKVTAARSKETKMPLGNLLLVFCPSLNMSPSLLRILCEAEGIWDGPPTQSVHEAVAAAARVSMGSISTPGVEHPRSVSRIPPSTDLRFPVIELDDASDHQRDSPDDAASFVSALEHSNGPTRSPSPLIYGTTIPPLLSSDSLDSSSVSEELVSPDPPSCKGVADSKSHLASANSLTIPDVASISIVSPRPTATVPFPSNAGSVPHSPVTHPPLSHRKSYTLLSFPHLRSESSPAEASCDELGQFKRPKRPSLHLLFSKKSSSSLPSAGAGNTSAVALSASSGTPAVNMRINAQHFPSSPPRLDTSISSSPIHLGFDANMNHLRGKDLSTVRSAPAIVSPTELEAPALVVRSDSGGSSLFSTPQSTPIADYYRGRTTSLFLPDVPGELAVSLRARSASQVSDTPSIDIEVAETQQDDWTQSVLLAARAGQSSS